MIKAMIKSLLILTGLSLFFSGCKPISDTYEAENNPSRTQPIKESKELSTDFLTDQKIKPLEIRSGRFNTVLGWYDEQTIFYLSQSGEQNTIHTYEIYSGDDQVFFDSEYPIIDMYANASQTLFAVRVAENYNNGSLLFVDRDGEQVYKWEGESTDLEVFWNPYTEEEVIVTAFKPDWDYEQFRIDVKRGKVDKLELPNPFVQWKDNSTLLYLDWNQEEMAITAPLYEVDLRTNEKVKLQEDIAGVFAFRNHILSITNPASDYALFTFYESESHQKINEWKVPILDSESEYFWVPNYSFDEKKHHFYYFRPENPDRLYDYRGAYELTAVSVETGESEKILTLSDNFPIECSPNGEYCLTGYQLENIVLLKSKEIVPLIKQS